MIPDELHNCFKGVKFDITREEVNRIFKHHNAHKTEYLPMEEFYPKLSCWKDYNRAAATEEEFKKEEDSDRRPITATVGGGAKGVRSLQSVGSASKFEQMPSKIDYFPNKSKHYLKM